MNRKNSIALLTKLHNQGLSYRQIGNRFGISKQRVHQLIKQPAYYNNPNYQPKPKKCFYCSDNILGESYLFKRIGNYVLGKKPRMFTVCEGCGYLLEEKGIAERA